MTPTELAATLEAYAARHAADSALWERVLPEAARALRSSATAVQEERDACQMAVSALSDGDCDEDYDAGWEAAICEAEHVINKRNGP